MEYKKWLLISGGDPAGIGYELILKTLPEIKKFFTPVVVVSNRCLQLYLKKFQFNLTPVFVSEKFLNDLVDFNLQKEQILCINSDDTKVKKFSPGKLSVITGKIAIQSIDLTLTIAEKFLNKRIPFGILTLPVAKNVITEYINKSSLKEKFVGHTEYIAEKFNISEDKISMLMVGKGTEGSIYKVLLLTRHIPLSAVGERLNVKNIFFQVINVAKFLLYHFLSSNEKLEIIFCGVNPHRGENGIIGNEEKKILFPAINLLNSYIKKHSLKIKQIFLPLQTETVFSYAKNRNNVLIVATYHDQGMTPLKILCGHNIVNITIGLPFLRVSPGHGIGIDIAGKNIAKIAPMLFTIEILDKLVK